jgi:hypothetical protein
MNDLSVAIGDALANNRCSVIHQSSVYMTDRPENAGKSGSIGHRGNSDVEVGHSFELTALLRAIGAHSSARLSLNNVRIFGRIADDDFPHYHGYSRRDLSASPGRFHFIFMTVHSIARYDPATGCVIVGECLRDINVNGEPGLILIHEVEGILVKEALEVGDAIILPSGVYHTFAALDGVYASYGAIEACDDAAFMYQGHHYAEDEREPREVLANTIRAMTGVYPQNIADLTLADIPGLANYVEPRFRQRVGTRV